MADKQNEKQNEKELGTNQRSLIQLALRIKFRDFFDPHGEVKKDLTYNETMRTVRNMKLGDSIENSVLKQEGFDGRNLKDWKNDTLMLLEKSLDTSNIKLDDKESILTNIGLAFETWYKNEYPNSKRKNFNGKTLSALDIANYALGAKKEKFQLATLGDIPPQLNKVKLNSLPLNTINNIKTTLEVA